LAAWKIINEEDAVLIHPKQSRRELIQSVSRYATTPLIFALSPNHSDITKFRPWSPIATGQEIIWIAPKKFQNT
jgi:phage terminase large subunit-like protein